MSKIDEAFTCAELGPGFKSLKKSKKMSKERITCRTHCIYWNRYDKDCELYGENHPCPRQCSDFFNQLVAENNKLRKQLKIATEDLFVICNNPSPTFNRITYARNSLTAIRSVK